MDFSNLWARFRAFVAPFHDPRVWTLGGLAFLIVWLSAPAIATSVLIWLLLAVLFPSVMVIISRHLFPQIHLTDLMAAVLPDKSSGLAPNIAAAIVAAAIILFVPIGMIAMAIWATH